MKEIKLIEEVLQKEYGKIPKVVAYTWIRRFLRYISKHHHNPLALIGGIFFASKYNQIGEYDPNIHTVFALTDKSNVLQNEFALYHELGHAYVYQRNPEMSYVNKRLEHAIQYAFTEPIPKNFEQDFVWKCVDEGIADFLAIESQKLEVRNGKKPEEVYCFRREWELVNFQSAEERQRFMESTPLDKEIAGKLGKNGGEFIEYVLSIQNAQSVSEAVRLISKAYENLPLYNFHLGHYLVRSSCLARASNTNGQVIDDLIDTPPVSINELQERTLQNIK